MISAYDCLITPVMTEKASKAGAENGKPTYVFFVEQEACKQDVARAVEKVFPDVKVDSVNILNRKGKKKIFRGRRGQTKPRKFAYVRLSEGSIKIENGF